MNQPARGSLLGIEHLDTKEILGLLKLARRMNPQKARPLLRGKRVVLLFYESSTRTRSSFEIAAKSLGAITTLVQSTGSSIEKGESVLDTGYTLRAVGADCIVMRHPSAGAPQLMAQHLDIPVINAGDGMHEHPSQALLDALTILKHKKSFKGLQATIIGDIFHSRVARSACHLLTRFGVKLTLCGPPEFVPDVATTLAPGLRVTRHIEDALRGDGCGDAAAGADRATRGAEDPAAGLHREISDDGGAAETGEAGRDRDASGTDYSRAGVDGGSGGRAAVGDCGRGSQWGADAHGDSGSGAGEGEVSHGFPRICTD